MGFGAKETTQQSAGRVDITPYTDSPRCVKCETTSVRYSYGECAMYVRGMHGELISMATTGGPREPHLKCRCVVCDYEWLIRPADYVAESDK